MSITSRDKASLDWGNLPFGYVRTDYNIRFYYKNGSWSEGELTADENISINIAAPSINYGQQAFEGMKAFETKDGRIVCFRPEENLKRLNRSCERIYMPQLSLEKFIDATKKVITANSRFVPPFGTGASMYLRPLMIGVGPKVGLGPADEYVFIMYVSPVGPYYKGGFKPVKALVVDQFDRAAPMGVGDCKVGGNYAAGLRGGEYGHDKGYPVVLYLDPREKKYIDEFSTSNFIGIKGNSYITPNSESILPSITNKSLAELAEDIGMTVERRPVAIEELPSYQEIGAVGTAAVITPVNTITYKGSDMTFGNGAEAGPVLTKLFNTYQSIQTGVEPDKFKWLTEI